MLKINLLPPTRFQRTLKQYREILASLPYVPVAFVSLVILTVICVLAPMGNRIYRGVRAIARRIKGIRRNIDENEVYRIVFNMLAAEMMSDRASGKLSFNSRIREQFGDYEVYVEFPPTTLRQKDCRALQLTIDIQDGRVLSSIPVPCRHDHYEL